MLRKAGSGLLGRLGPPLQAHSRGGQPASAPHWLLDERPQFLSTWLSPLGDPVSSRHGTWRPPEPVIWGESEREKGSPRVFYDLTPEGTQQHFCHIIGHTGLLGKSRVGITWGGECPRRAGSRGASRELSSSGWGEKKYAQTPDIW